MDYLLHVGAYIFTREDALNIYRFYSVEHLTVWQIKERDYPMAKLREIGVVITHGKMDLPYNQMLRFTFDPAKIELGEYNIGQPSLLWYQNRGSREAHIYLASYFLITLI